MNTYIAIKIFIVTGLIPKTSKKTREGELRGKQRKTSMLITKETIT